MKAFFSPTDENPRLHFLGCHVMAYGGSWIAAAQHGDVGGEVVYRSPHQAATVTEHNTNI